MDHLPAPQGLQRIIRIGRSQYPLVLPNVRDPRLHLAAVIITIHILGQTDLGFRVSVPQILSAIVTCALLEVVRTFISIRQVVWPASALLTGSGVALILRIVGAERGNHWAWDGWYLFALVAGLSLLSKYVIRYHGAHLFNPSNLGLVVAFLWLGSSVIEPLDFWWAPISPGMAFAYLIILIGGLLITARLRLLTLVTTFWVTLAAGLGVLAGFGHCIVAAWALQPVCGADFWWVVVTSPELLIFLFFMITDPKTIPRGGAARMVFGVALGLTCTLLIAPQRTEFGAKVGLLAGLVLLTPFRFAFDRWITLPSANELLKAMAIAPARRMFSRPFLRGAAAGSSLVLVVTAIVAAGFPARGAPISTTETPVDVGVQIDPALLPFVSVSAEAAALNTDAAADPQRLAVDLAEALIIEGQALATGDTSLLRGVTEGERLVTMERNVQVAATLGRFVVPQYLFDSLHLDVFYANGPQGGASLALAARGKRIDVEYDSSGRELGRAEEAFVSVFVLSPGNGDRWLVAAEISGA
ncbi:MAG: hypothetical protein ACT4OP_13115 [Actinomycetota bacterium]